MKKEHTIEERLELSLLYDFYGALLKENQRRMFEASVLEDYNFSEIAQDEGITRQGAYDTVKRAIKQLEMYEDKLGLVAKFREQKEMAKKLESIGIDSSEKLTQSGSRQAFLKLKQAYPNVCLVHLYALEGAVRDVEFNSLSKETKMELKEFSDYLKS